MALRRWIFRTLIGLFFIAGLAQCGAKGKSSEVALDLVPNQPIVITGSTTVNNQTINAPWFSFRVKLTNNSGEDLTIVAVSVTVTYTDTSGIAHTNTKSFTPSQYDYSNNIDNCQYDTNFDNVPSDGQPHILTVTYQGSDTNCLTPRSDPFYLGDNPAVDGTSYHYNVKVTPEGWFGSASDPQDRFTRDGFFSTQ